MEKQIEEIKDCIDSVYGCDCAYFGVDGLAIAAAIYNADYRKQSDTAREIFAEIDVTWSERTSVCEFFENIAELKKKYAEGNHANH